MKKLMIMFVFVFLGLLVSQNVSAFSFPVCNAPSHWDKSTWPWTCVAPEPEPLVCTLPEVLNEAGDACITPEPEILVCVEPQVLNETGDACIDPVVEHTPDSVKENTGGSTSGSYTREAWAKIQASWNKPVYVWDNLKPGDKGDDVKTFQMVLNYKGANLKVDGIYGPLTLGAFNLYINK